ncbi:MAG TPA: sugar phosphate nucleotidyltransferase [Fimbriimonas sp.]|nr:sugar phosphate nucleotidyltransferase [Fimbriimonas sp.]
MVAIIPAGGKGTRMNLITHGAPKELLRLGSKTVLQRVVDEAREAEVQRIVVVSAPNKPALSLAATELGAEVMLQEQMLGLGDAIACAGVVDEALILYGDCVFEGPAPSFRMAELIRRGIDGCIAVESVDDEGTKQYGIVEVGESTGQIQRLLEKPGPEGTKSRWAIAARFAFGAPLMAFLQEFRAKAEIPEGKELSMTPVFSAAVEAGFDLKAVPLQPGTKRIDCGSPEEYAAARWLQWD